MDGRGGNNNKNAYRHNNKKSVPNISAQRRFKESKASPCTELAFPLQGTPVADKAPNILTNDTSCKTDEEGNQAKTYSKSYSSRNMLRNSRTATTGGTTGPSENSADRSSPQERLPWQILDDPKKYLRLTCNSSDCFIYQLADRAVCLLCGKRVNEHSIEQHINSTYHLSQYRKLDLRLLNENQDESSLQMCTLEALCDIWYTTYSLTDNLIESRNLAINDFEQILGSINPECDIRIHGSSFYSAATRDSDVDLELVHPNSKIFEFDPRSKNSIHHRLIDPDAEYGNQFNEHTMHYDLISNPVDTLYKIHRIVNDSSKSLPSYPFTTDSNLNRLNLKMPSIILNHRATRTPLEITCYSGRRFHLAKLLRSYIGLDYRAHQLCTLVKIWAKLCGIDNPDYGTYPPHAYIIMMIYFLQRTDPPVLPCLHDLATRADKTSAPLNAGQVDPTNISQQDEDKNTELPDDESEEDENTSMSGIDDNFLQDLNWNSENKTSTYMLFIQFFKNMMDEFSMISNVITIRTLERVFSPSNNQSKAIEHPINKEINISRCIASMKTFEFIKECFFHTYFYLNSIPIDANLKKRKLNGNDPRNHIQLYVNTERMLPYLSMKGPSVGDSEYDPITQMIHQRLFARDIEAVWALSSNNLGAQLPITLAKLYDLSQMRPQKIAHSYSCTLCRAVGHGRSGCDKGFVEKIGYDYLEYDFELDQRVNFDTLLLKLYKDEMITEKLSQKHAEIVGTLKNMINAALDMNLNFTLYGSTVNNLGHRESDLDICVTVKNSPTGKGVDCVDILKNIQKVLETCVNVNEIQPVFSARVPIIRFKYYNFDVDLSMYNQCAIFNSKLLKAYSKINQNVAPLCSIVKKFAKLCGIADASKGSLSSYAWCLLVIYYLQQMRPPKLPVLQEPVDSPVRGSFGVNGWNVWFHDKPIKLPGHPLSLTQLLKGFFLFYASFDFEDTVIAVRKSTRITKYQKSWNGCMIAIEDPFELTYNLANRLSDQMATYIMNFFAQAHKHIIRTQQLIDTGREGTSDHRVLKRLFDAISITRVAPPVRGCLTCHKIGHKIKDCPERIANNRSQKSKRNPNFEVGKWRAPQRR